MSDTGVGMAPEVQARVFEPFFTTKEPGKGTGLGLATVYGIVKQCGGSIWVYSELGHGTTFKIYFPAVEEATLPEAEASPSTPDARHGQETILVVEDSASLRIFVRRILQGLGYTVVLAANGDEGVQVAEQHSGAVDLLLTDVVMPGMDGRSLAQRLKTRRPHLKVLYMSGYTDNVIVHHGVLDPGVTLLPKPFTADTLALKVREELGRA
jgi:CheY-like chemotaxis protein